MSENEEEVEAMCKVAKSMSFYEKYAGSKFRQQITSMRSFTTADQQLIGPLLQTHIKEALICAKENQNILNKILSSGLTMFPDNDSFQKALEKTEMNAVSSEHYMSKCRSTLKQIVRDWSAEGANERESCYGRIIRAITDRYPDKSERHNLKVLVPGCAASRLNWELLREGFSVMGNEFSFFMILASNFLLNNCKKINEFTIYPYILDFSNCWTFKDSIRPVMFPDVDPSVIRSSMNSFSMCAGDFLSAFDEESDIFDSVVGVFFLDTAANPLDYMRTIFRILKPGGRWFNYGPLTYHFEDDPEKLSVSLPFDVIIQLAEKVGFQMECVEGKGINPPSLYTSNPDGSMLHYLYKCGYFECRKPK